MVQYQCSRCGNVFNMQQPMPEVHCPICGGECISINPQQSNNNGFQAWQTAYGPQYASGQQVRQPDVFDEGPSGKSRGIAGLLAILLGSIGVHYFYLGKIGGGIICILLTLITCGLWSILTLIQGILFFTMPQEKFEQKYVYSTSTFPLF
ncbi:MAG: NINE protein [Bacteroidaceae bacterium]|nr:NINE protein [Bacteroidaceae bacterium]